MNRTLESLQQLLMLDSGVDALPPADGAPDPRVDEAGVRNALPCYSQIAGDIGRCNDGAQR